MTAIARIGPWLLSCDEEANRRAYALMDHGASGDCRCPCCANFQLVRKKHFPEGLAQLLATLGADPSRECSVRRVAPLTGRLSLYAGSFALEGTLLDGPLPDTPDGDAIDVFEPLEPGVFVAVRRWRHPPAPWPEGGCLRLRFLMLLPWHGTDPAPPLNLARCKGRAKRRS